MASRPTFNKIQKTLDQLASTLQVRPPKWTIVCHSGEDLRLVAERYSRNAPPTLYL
jgi:hypothetical protein